MIERGEVSVTLAMVARLARALGISLVELFAELEREAPDAGGG